MQTKSGWLSMNKTERKAIETMLEHAERDISYGFGGTFGDGEEFNDKKGREIEAARKGIKYVRWILETYLD